MKRKISIIILLFAINFSFISCNQNKFINNRKNDNIEEKSKSQNDSILFKSPKLKWKFKVDNNGVICSSPVINRDTIYFASIDFTDSENYLYALNIDTGKIKWKIKARVIGSPILYNDYIYYNDNGNISVVSLKGKIVNKFNDYKDKKDKGFKATMSPLIFKNRLIMGYSNGSSSNIKIYDLEGGKILKTIELGEGDSPYSLSLKDNFLYWISSYSSIKGMNIDSYEELEKLYCFGQIEYYDIYERFLCASTKFDGLFCINMKTGKKLWNFRGKFEKEEWLFDFVTIKEKTVYFYSIYGDHDSIFYSLNLETGEILWNVELKGLILSCYPSITNGKIYFPVRYRGFEYNVNKDNYIYCVDLTTGKLLWRYSINGNIPAEYPTLNENGNILINNGRLYFGCSDGYLYCLE